MPPKKYVAIGKKKKQKGDGAGEGRTKLLDGVAEGFLLRQALGNDLQRRLEEAEAQLREEAKLIDRLTRENQSKNEHIQSMEVAMTNEIEKHEAIMQVLKDKEMTQKHELEHRIEVLNSKICELQVRMESCSTLDSVNASLRLRVDELMRQLEAENKNHIDEIHSMRLDMFNHKMALEQTFRKSLQELDAQYLKKAFNAMAEESKNALIANAKLKDELQMQSIGVENLMHRFKTQAEQYHKMKVENEILEKGSSLRLKEISTLKTSQHDVERKIQEVRAECAERENQVQESSSKAIEDLKQDNKALRALYEQAQKRCQKWKSRYVALMANQNVKPEGVATTEEGATDEIARLSRHQSASALETMRRPSQGPFDAAAKNGPPLLDPKAIWSASCYAESLGSPGMSSFENNRCTSAPMSVHRRHCLESLTTTTRRRRAASRFDVEMPLKHMKGPMNPLIKLKRSTSQKPKPSTLVVE
ncbi:Aste57867_19063 [Aphanomyces stellatus]|uniref:Aste57867_19063 protein n=1 Tax=Aphanomyces stellatus TaxID=120398 RepID=A0A485LBZ5_9STRA|nr:hypothetical protein As57867_018999 [Aphanomyces stellatus]VFT95788.1 Aste57867_19063 [Aphanomyces stellatus]